MKLHQGKCHIVVGVILTHLKQILLREYFDSTANQQFSPIVTHSNCKKIFSAGITVKEILGLCLESDCLDTIFIQAICRHTMVLEKSNYRISKGSKSFPKYLCVCGYL